MSKIYLATTNPGKLREFQEAAHSLALNLELLPRLRDLPPAIEDGDTFEQNALIKAEHYSRLVPAELDLVLAEDSGLAVDQLGGAPGVHSARYASVLQGKAAGPLNSDDEDNNRVLISQLERLPPGKHAGKYVCVIAVARKGQTLACFVGEAPGELLTKPRGTGGFGYDPLFLFPSLGKTFAELTLEQKRQHSHRGKAFRQFLDWYSRQAETP
jgi:XTP/dITP diphosphohydrolase